MAKLILALAFYSAVYAADPAPGVNALAAGIKAKAVQLVAMVVGEDRAYQLFGMTKDQPNLEVKLPAIPQIDKDAKSVKGYDYKEPTEKEPPKDQKDKYDYLFVRELFSATRNRLPTDEELSRWLNVLQQGGTREGVYRALVLDQDYASLESDSGFPANDQMKQYFVDYFEKYLNKKISMEQIATWNLYSLKRVIVERTLEVVDELRLKEADLYDWYGVFSADVGKAYPDLWKNSMRKIDLAHVHRDWAKAVPKQHIKSEVIIKLHKILNFLYNAENTENREETAN